MRISKWLSKPTWFEFIELMIVWALLLGTAVVGLICSAETRPVWQTALYVLLLLLLYAVMFCGGYYYVKNHHNNVRQ